MCLIGKEGKGNSVEKVPRGKLCRVLTASGKGAEPQLHRNAPACAQIEMNYCFRGTSDTSFEGQLIKPVGIMWPYPLAWRLETGKGTQYFIACLGHTCGTCTERGLLSCTVDASLFF